jgi:uncharacterized membrane protein
MEKFFEGLVIALGVMVVVAIVAVLGGTLVFWIWPVAIPAVFPGLVATGTIAGKISWWTAVCFTWLCGLLIKNTQTHNNNK